MLKVIAINSSNRKMNTYNLILQVKKKIGRSIRTINDEITKNECNNFIKHRNKDSKNYKPSLEALINFQVQRVLAYKLIGLDSEY